MLRDGEEDVARGSDQRDQREQANGKEPIFEKCLALTQIQNRKTTLNRTSVLARKTRKMLTRRRVFMRTKKKLKMKTVPVRVEMEILKTTELLLQSDDGSANDSDNSDDGSKGSEAQAEISPNSHRISPNPHPKSDLRVKSAVSAWFYGFESSFDSWDRFHAAFYIFQLETFQRFTKRTSTSVTARNKQIVASSKARKVAGKKTRKAVTLVPDEWVTYSKTLVCTHGQPYEPKGKGKRNHNNVRDTNCPARVNLTVTASISGRWYLRANASGSHNHAVSKHTYEGYTENRTVKDPQLKSDVAVLRKAGATAKGILQYLQERTGKKTNLKDVHNMVQRHNASVQAGLTDAQRAFAVLEDFTRQRNGNAAQVLVDSETNIARIATFQTARMKRLFKASPEIVFVDSTHNTNANRYKLFSFMVHDVFGKGQYVHHALVDSEEKDNLRRVVEIFKENNPEWGKIQLFMSDKAIHQKDLATRLTPGVKEDAKSLMRDLVYAKSSAAYEESKATLLRLLGDNSSHKLYKTFVDNWDQSKDEWVTYKRGDVPHLTNNTNNRIESQWGKIKNVVEDSYSIDQLLSTLIALQVYAEEQYLAEYHRVGSRPTRESEDEELTKLAIHISPFAHELLSKEHYHATGTRADYTVQLDDGGMATVTSAVSGDTHEVNTRTSSCNCIFTKTCLLPCRHVMFVRSTCNFETCVPPMRYFATRWIRHSPENDIDEGDVSTGGLKQKVLPSVPKGRALSSSNKYIEAKAITEKIVDRLALQSTPTFRVALTWLENFFEALNAGEVVDFSERGNPVFLRLSSTSSGGVVRELDAVGESTPSFETSTITKSIPNPPKSHRIHSRRTSQVSPQ
ncbi:hypothetical protein F441_09646 [Phytophthora nicotianae CJ01A1]|uniref:SWIM-type domain-containing protein n=1 Tax=Phytophthora nicotianae CJ01A1 TaxID=1317063 RepID=W2WZ77_PHYNI|nr:hypothetical protein F441_09646 [Phytophthora nicotianae CJ01A1]